MNLKAQNCSNRSELLKTKAAGSGERWQMEWGRDVFLSEDRRASIEGGRLDGCLQIGVVGRKSAK